MNILKQKLLKNKKLIKIFQLIITIILFYILFTFIDFEKLKLIIKKANIYYIIIWMSLYIPWIIISSYKWKTSIKSITNEDFKILSLIKYYWIWNFISNFLPSSIWWDSYRYYEIRKKIKNKRDSFNSIFFERVTWIISLSIINIILFVVFYKEFFFSKNLLYFIPLILSTFILLLLIFKNSIKRMIKIKKIINFLNKIKYNNNIFFLLLLSVVFLVISTLMIKFYLLAFGIDYINILYLMLLISSSNLIWMIPISLNSIWLSESVWVVYLSLVWVPIEIWILTAITWRVALILMTSFWGLLLLKKE